MISSLNKIIVDLVFNKTDWPVHFACFILCRNRFLVPEISISSHREQKQRAGTCRWQNRHDNAHWEINLIPPNYKIYLNIFKTISWFSFSLFLFPFILYKKALHILQTYILYTALAVIYTLSCFCLNVIVKRTDKTLESCIRNKSRV
jgi:hypothetical protein